jgi:hypothetical protein
MAKDKDSVEGLKDKLYSRQNNAGMQDVRAPLSHEESEVQKAWSDLPPRQPQPFVPTQESRMSFATKFFIVSVGFFLVALAVAAVAFFWGPNTISPNNITVQIVAPSLVDGGKQADFQIIIDNRNPAPLQSADLVIDYPDGSRNPQDPVQTLLHQRISLGTIGAAAQVKQTGSVILYGAEGAQETVRATIEYGVQGSNAVFTQSGQVTITIGSAPVSVSVNTPAQAVAGQSFPIDVVVRSNATTPVNNVVVQGQLPFGYSMTSSSPAARSGTLWQLGTLNPGDTQTIHMVGTIDGQDGDQRVFKFLVGQDSDPTDTTVKVPFLTMPATITVTRPFIGGSLTVNGKTGGTVSASAGGTVQGVVNLQNNLSTAVQNVQVTLKLSGPMIDTASINAGTGFYQSSTNSIIWTPDRDPTLAQMAAGGTAQLTFSFNTLPPGQGGVIYTNPQASLNLSVSGQNPGDGSGAPQAVSAAASMQITFASQLSLSAAAQHLSGPQPPVANASTAYTVQWTVKNASNTVGNAAVSTVLPPYTTFVSGQPGVAYDAGSHTVTWSIGDLNPGVGYTSAALSSGFTVSVVPSTSQAGTAPTLTGTALLSGTDRFAGVAVSASAEAPTTVDNVAPAQ